MVLEDIIFRLGRELSICLEESKNGISSQYERKENALNTLANILELAPKREFITFSESSKYYPLTNFLLHTLCEILRTDKSNRFRSQALHIILTFATRIDSTHKAKKSCNVTFPNQSCVIQPVAQAIPGVSSALFKFIMSDTKLPTKLLALAVKCLTKFIGVTYTHCPHLGESDELDLENIAVNLGLRLNCVLKYLINYSGQIGEEVTLEVINLCSMIISDTNTSLINMCITTMVKYIAHIRSSNLTLKPNQTRNDIESNIMNLVSMIKSNMGDCDNEADNLESIIIEQMTGVLRNLDEHCLTMLPSERLIELSALDGFLRLMPAESITTFFELIDKRAQLLRIFTRLTEFSAQQPFLFLTETKINDQAIETNTNIYTVEKRFTHLHLGELDAIINCCRSIGANVEWLLLDDVFRNDLCQFSDTNNLLVTNFILDGCISRTNDSHGEVQGFCKRYIDIYITNILDMIGGLNRGLELGILTEHHEVLKAIVAIETILTLVRIYLAKIKTDWQTVVLLKPILYPLLSWSSSSNRAISEAALSSLTYISQLYKKDSIKSLIESNIDYIVDGVSRHLDRFADHTEITNVIAVTLKLSSSDTFHYFSDIFERVFKLLASHHHTPRSKSIALLFYRTLNVLNDWKDAKCPEKKNSETFNPLEYQVQLAAIKDDLSIEKRINRLQEILRKKAEIDDEIEKMDTSPPSQEQIIKEIQSGKPEGLDETRNQEGEEETKKPSKSRDVEIAEKILKHCVGLASSNYNDTKILALKASTCGFRLLRDDEETLLPLVHQIWTPLLRRLTGDYGLNLEVNMCAFECLLAMAYSSRDFIKSRAVESIIPRLCVFLESQVAESRDKKDYGPYCMTMAFKCQRKILSNLGPLAYHIELAYTNLWRVVRVSLLYLNYNQVPSLREAARHSLNYLLALDADCVWYYAKKSGQLNELPFDSVFELQSV